MTSNRLSLWLYRAYELGATAGAVAICYTLFVWMFGIAETSTKLWLLAALVGMPVINWLGEYFMILPRAISLVKGRNIVTLMRRGFGRQRSQH